jgi:hypothetical protein
VIKDFEICGLPFVPHLSGYRLEIEGVPCLLSRQGPPERRHWSVRGLKGGVIALGRTAAAAVRLAGRVLREGAR